MSWCVHEVLGIHKGDIEVILRFWGSYCVIKILGLLLRFLRCFGGPWGIIGGVSESWVCC